MFIMVLKLKGTKNKIVFYFLDQGQMTVCMDENLTCGNDQKTSLSIIDLFVCMDSDVTLSIGVVSTFMHEC